MTIELMKKIFAMPSIGNFKCIELFEVFGIKDKNPAFNIFTLAVAHETDLCLVNKEKVTPHPIKLKTDKFLKFGIFRSIISIENFLNVIYNLDIQNLNKDNDNKLIYAQLKDIPIVYVPASLEQSKNEFLGLLKNNFFCGSHILEWFDESKKYVTPLIENPKVLDEFSEKLQTYLPLKIGTHSDRLGNIIMQIPCSAVAFKIEKRIKNGYQLLSNLAVSPNLSEDIKLSGIFWGERDGSIIDFQKIPLAVGKNIIPLQQNGYYVIWDEDNSIICAGGQVGPIFEFGSISVSVNKNNPRIFKLPDGRVQKINMETQPILSIKGKKTKDYRHWSRNRLLKIEKQELHNSLKLGQFKQGMRPKALDFIRELLRKYGRNGIYLWDPYLNFNDLLETVFFSPYPNIPIKALTGLKKPTGKKNKTQSYERNCTDEPNRKLEKEFNEAILEKSGLNLTFVKSKNIKFHDRFIIFPQEIDEPIRAWSLGTSVNSLGNSHHIIQEVEDGQIIADAFEEMWKLSISDEGNIIWKSKIN